MRLIIDAREACHTERTGKGQWTREFLMELAKNKEIEITLVVEDHHYTDWVMSPHVVVRRFDPGPLWHFRVARALRTGDLTGTYVATTSFIIPFLMGSRIPTAIVVHDLIAFRGEPHNWKATFIERLTLGRCLRHASSISTLSENTKSDLVKKFSSIPEDRITAIFAGPMRDLPQTRMPDDHTILCIATLCPRKNQKRLIQAFASLTEEQKAGYSLVLCGARGWQDSGIVRLASKTSGVEWRGHITDEEYGRMLSTCTIFALPSLYEGFGMQILDALRMGVPVLTSDRGSLQEVVGDAAFVIDPENVEMIADALKTLIADPKLRASFSEKGPKQAEQFSWKDTVELFLGSLK